MGKIQNVDIYFGNDVTCIDNIESYICHHFSFRTHEIGIAEIDEQCIINRVISKVIALGMPIVLIFTSNRITEYQQRLNHIRNNLSQFLICSESDDVLFEQNRLIHPVVLVIKKNYYVLQKWLNVFKSTGYLRDNPLFVVEKTKSLIDISKRENRLSNCVNGIIHSASSSIYCRYESSPNKHEY